MRNNQYKSSKTRKTKRLKKRFLFALKAACALLALLVLSTVLVFGHDVLTQSRFFEAREVIVKGNARLTKQEVLNQAQVQSGINLLSVNLSVLRKRLLAHQWIAEAEVRRELPDRLHLTIQEHRALAVLDLGRKLLINTRGDIFKEKSAGDPHGLPMVTGLKYTDINVAGAPRSRPYQAVMDILSLSRNSAHLLSAKTITGIDVDREIGLTVYLSENIKEIKLGYRNYVAKLKRLQKVLQYVKRQPAFLGFESIDLNDMHRIVVRPIRKQPSAADL